MPYRYISPDEAARYLNLSSSEVQKLVAQREIPFEIRGDRTVFRRQDLDDWASQRILSSRAKRLDTYHERTSRRSPGVGDQEALLPPLITPARIEPALPSKTKASAIRDMVKLASRTNWVCDPAELVESLEARENLCPTAVPGGVAFLHPRSRQPYRFEASFLALGRSLQPIHFCAPDGHPTDLFFLLCFEDERLHLRTLARLCFMGLKTDLLSQLHAASDAVAMHESLIAAEQHVISG